MDLTNDSIKEICSRMDVDSIYNFIQTSQQNQDLCVNIYNLKYYEELEYPELIKDYEVKQKILAVLFLAEKKDIEDPDHIHVVTVKSYNNKMVNRNRGTMDKYGLLTGLRYFDQLFFREKNILNIPGYHKLFIFGGEQGKADLIHPHTYRQLQYIMSLEDPNIKLKELRKLI